METVDMKAGVTEKFSCSGRRIKETEEGCDEKKVYREKEDKVKPRGYVVKKGGTTGGGDKAWTEEGDMEGGEVKTGKGDEEKTEDDDENGKKTNTEDGDMQREYRSGCSGGHEGDKQRVKGDDVNTGLEDGGERKMGEDDARTEGKEEEEEEEALMEEVLTAVGLGRWQVPLILTAFIIQAVLPIHELGSALFNAPLPFHCSLPSPNASTTLTTNISEYESECLGTERQEERMLEMEVPYRKVSGPPSCPVVQYNTTIFVSTVTSQWNLVCEWQPLQPMFQTAFAIGSVVGDLTSGYLSDKLGRRMVMRLGAAISLPASLVMVISPWYSLTLFMRMVLGVTDLLSMVPLYTIMMESCPPGSRSLLSISTSFASSISMMCLGGVSFVVRDWRLLLLICTAPSAVLVILVILLDESPRWLAQRGRGHQAAQLLTKAAKLNKSTIPQHLLTRLYEEGGEAEQRQGRQDLGRPAPKVTSLLQEVKECAASPVMRQILVASSVLAICNGMIWVGIPINANNFDSERPQQYILLIGVADGVSVLLSLALTESVPRRLLGGAGQAFVALFIFLILFVPPGWGWVRWVLMMMAFCLNAVVYEITLVYFVELVPTIVRSKCITIIELARSVGDIIVPFITDLLGPEHWWSTDGFFIGAAVCGGLAVLFLPETRHQPLPDTIADVEERHRRAKRETMRRMEDCHSCCRPYCCCLKSTDSDSSLPIIHQAYNSNTSLRQSSSVTRLHQNGINSALYQSNTDTIIP